MEESSVVLDVQNLEIDFMTKTARTKAVRDVSFQLRKGETFGLVGESGCGKTTVCRALLRLVREPGKITGGHIYYKEKDIATMKEKQLRSIRGNGIGMIFQEPMTALNPVLRMKEQIFEALAQKGLSQKAMMARAEELFGLVGIPMPKERLNEYCHQFSGGMRQRAMIAIALAAEPEILIADEPTTALDVTIQDQIMKLLNRLKAEIGMSIVLVTHDLGVVSQMCDRVAVMYAGNIVETTDSLSLFSKPRHPYTYGLLSSLVVKKEKGSRLEPIPGTPPDLSKHMDGCPFEPRCKFSEEKCQVEMPTLVEVEPEHFTMCHFYEKLIGLKGAVDPE